MLVLGAHSSQEAAVCPREAISSALRLTQTGLAVRQGVTCTVLPPGSCVLIDALVINDVTGLLGAEFFCEPTL